MLWRGFSLVVEIDQRRFETRFGTDIRVEIYRLENLCKCFRDKSKGGEHASNRQTVTASELASRRDRDEDKPKEEL